MTIRLLRTLVAVADNRTFSAAADAVHVTHAAVSQQMRTLEADLGVALFNRSTRTPELTPIAHEIVAKARKLIAEYDGLVPSVLDDGGMTGTLRIGAIGTTLTGLTPQAMAVLKSRSPKLGLHIRPGLTRGLIADIERGDLDAAIVSKPDSLAHGLRFHDLAQETMHLIASKQEAESDPMVLLQSRPFIRFKRDAVVGALIEDWIADRRIRVTETMELDSAEAITSMVQANLGISIVPKLAVLPTASPPVKSISLGNGAPTRMLCLVHRTDQFRAVATKALRDALKDTLADQERQHEQ